MIVQIEIEIPVKVQNCERHPVTCQRPIVLHKPLQRLPTKVETIKIGILLFKLCNDTERLGIVIEPSPLLHQLVKRILSDMTKRCVSEIMGKGQTLGQIFIHLSARASERAICATSMEWVKRVL